MIHKLMNFINNRVYSNASNIVLLGNEMKELCIESQYS